MIEKPRRNLIRNDSLVAKGGKKPVSLEYEQIVADEQEIEFKIAEAFNLIFEKVLERRTTNQYVSKPPKTK